MALIGLYKVMGFWLFWSIIRLLFPYRLAWSRLWERVLWGLGLWMGFCEVDNLIIDPFREILYN
jgi:hypothetical protein